jgi:hypothetical protein
MLLHMTIMVQLPILHPKDYMDIHMITPPCKGQNTGPFQDVMQMIVKSSFGSKMAAELWPPDRGVTVPEGRRHSQERNMRL